MLLRYIRFCVPAIRTFYDWLTNYYTTYIIGLSPLSPSIGGPAAYTRSGIRLVIIIIWPGPATLVQFIYSAFIMVYYFTCAFGTSVAAIKSNYK